jgi:GT2 family glycosyltransferase
MKQVEYLNPKNHTVHLVGPDKTQISIGPHSKVVLSDWFQKYAPRYLRVLRTIGEESSVNKVRPQPKIQSIIKPVAFSGVKSGRQSTQTQPVQPKQVQQAIISAPRIISTKNDRNRPARAAQNTNRRAVGRIQRGDLNAMYSNAVNSGPDVSISNNIGIGILSYNRPDSLRRLLGSLMKYSDLSRVTVFVSDESTDKDGINPVLSQFASKVTILNNSTRLGVAGNSNRLLKCLDRFAFKFLLNDDVEILAAGWENFYINAMRTTGFHHFCFREPGLHGADGGSESNKNGLSVLTVNEKPHGAVIAFDEVAFKAVGYFDEQFGLYGMEHVDWSHRISMSGLQPVGYHDIAGSVNFIKLHGGRSATEDRVKLLNTAREYYNNVSSNKSRIYVEPTPASDVPSVSVVIPYRQEDRKEDLISVINNMRAMRFPRVEIIISEQDQISKTDVNAMSPITHYFTPNGFPSQPFCKAAAFNRGIINAKNEFIVLHDADIMVSSNYLSKIYETLCEFEGCHISAKVFYLDEGSSKAVNDSGYLTSQHQCERVVGYFEGGSLACRKASYIGIGGFNEDYIGYGVEDCDFFERLSTVIKFNENRTFNLFHLHHGRTQGWQQCHDANKKLEIDLRNKYPNIKDYAAYLRKKLAAKYGV